MKRAFALLFLAALLLCASTALALSSGDFSYELMDDGTIRLTWYTGSDEYLTLPARLDGRRVTAIGSRCFSGCWSLKEAVIPEGVVRIDDRAFWGCSALRAVSLPEGLQSLGDQAFEGCSALTDVILPRSVTIIGSNCFNKDAALVSVIIPAEVTDIGKDAFKGCGSLTLVVAKGSFADRYCRDNALAFSYDPTAIDPPAAAPVSAEAAVTAAPASQVYLDCEYQILPEGVAKLMRYTGSAQSVVIPDTVAGYPVTIIAVDAFRGHARLASVTVPGGVTSIGQDAFADCPLLVLTVDRDSAAVQYCKTYGVAYEYPDAHSWLGY